MGRSAFIFRREGRYLFRTRRPTYLLANRSAGTSFRISLRTAEYPVAVRRAAKIASWMLRMKSVASVEEAIRELFPKLGDFAPTDAMAAWRSGVVPQAQAFCADATKTRRQLPARQSQLTRRAKLNFLSTQSREYPMP
jgi:hypothetical protein